MTKPSPNAWQQTMTSGELAMLRNHVADAEWIVAHREGYGSEVYGLLHRARVLIDDVSFARQPERTRELQSGVLPGQLPLIPGEGE